MNVMNNYTANRESVARCDCGHVGK